MKELCKKLCVELIGTFFLVLTIGLAAFSGATGVIPPIAIGFALMIMVYAGGHVSGGHYNPAVSTAAAIRGAFPWSNLIPYWIAQALGAFLAALIVKNYIGYTAAAEYTFDLTSLIICELLFTFALCYVVLHTATATDTDGNSYYGLAIGATVTVGAFATAGLCFGAFNPAVTVGLFTLGAGAVKLLGITALTNLVGGIAAGIVYKFTNND